MEMRIIISCGFSWRKLTKGIGISLSSIFGFAILVACLAVKAGNQIPVSAPMTTDLSGKTADVAFPSVFRIICDGKGEGTGFLHRSGRIITAFHVVEGCSIADIKVLRTVMVSPGVMSVKAIGITNVVADTNSDLALLTPDEPVEAPSLQITTNLAIRIGSQVCTWGFPGGYTGGAPLLSSGYLAGIQWDALTNGVQRPMLVVNAAFNGGNSGGPLVDVESGEVMGVVVSKLAPIPPQIQQAIDVLANEHQGMVYRFANGTNAGSISEAQLVAGLVTYLRTQVQLVIGYTATPGNLRNFLSAQGINH